MNYVSIKLAALTDENRKKNIESVSSHSLLSDVDIACMIS